MAPKCLALAIIAVMAAVTKADNSCAYAWDGACDEGSYCPYGTDSSDCYGGDTCSYAWDGMCDEPAYCAYGTDSTDCRGLTNSCTYAYLHPPNNMSCCLTGLCH